MHLTNAIIDVKTGNPVVAGEIVLVLGKHPPVELPAHTHVMVDFGYRALAFRAVAQMKRLENGFYDVTTAEPCLSIQPLERDALGATPDKESRIRVSGPDCGAFRRGFSLLGKVVGFELVQQLQAGGLAFLIDGAFEEAPVNDAPKLPAGAGFEIRGLIPWEVLRLYGLQGRFDRDKFVDTPEEHASTPIESLERLDPFSLADLRIGFGLNEPLAAGHMDIGRHGAHHAVAVRCSASGLSLTAADRSELGDDGFCSLRKQRETRFHSDAITLSWIEQLLWKKDRAKVGLSGEGIGGAVYSTGHMLEPGLYEIICLDADRLDLEVSLSGSGLRISVAATLSSSGRRATSISTFVSQFNSLTQFSAAVTLPWSLLLLTKSRLAERRDAFLKV